MTANYYRELEKSTACSEKDSELYFRGFVQKYLLKDKKKRWVDLLIKRSKKLFKESHKLNSSLDKYKCTMLREVPLSSSKQKVLFFDFIDKPVWLEEKIALRIAENKEILVLADEGKRAYLFSHDGGCWECK